MIQLLTFDILLLSINNMNVIKFVDLELDGVDTNDHPDYVDSFISSATAVLEDGNTRDATEDELNELTDDRDLVYNLLIDYLY